MVEELEYNSNAVTQLRRNFELLTNQSAPPHREKIRLVDTFSPFYSCNFDHSSIFSASFHRHALIIICQSSQGRAGTAGC